MQVKSTFPDAKLVIRVLTDDSKSHCKYVSYYCNIPLNLECKSNLLVQYLPTCGSACKLART